MEKIYTKAAQKDIDRLLAEAEKAKSFSAYLYETQKKNLHQVIDTLGPKSGETLDKVLSEYLSKYQIAPEYRVSFKIPFVIFFKVGADEILIIRVFNKDEKEDRNWIEEIKELFDWVNK
jgi:plasmid stabilization system protein ParE